MTADLVSLEELARITFKTYDRNSLLNTALYIAHTHSGKSIRELSEQTRYKQDEIEDRIEFVRTQLNTKLGTTYGKSSA